MRSERPAEYLKLAREARASALDPELDDVMRASFLRTGDAYERMANLIERRLRDG